MLQSRVMNTWSHVGHTSAICRPTTSAVLLRELVNITGDPPGVKRVKARESNIPDGLIFVGNKHNELRIQRNCENDCCAPAWVKNVEACSF